MSRREAITTWVAHDDPILEVGLEAILRETPGLRLMPRPAPTDVQEPPDDGDAAGVGLVVADYRQGMRWLDRPRGEAVPAAVRVIILTGLEGEREVRAALAAGVAGLIGQGCPVEEVRRAATSVAHGARYISPPVAHQLAESLMHDALTDREAGVLQLVAAGLCNKKIARELGITVATVKSHVSSVLEKLHVGSRTEAISRAAERRLIVPPGQGRTDHGARTTAG